MIYVSTGGVRSKSAYEFALDLYRHQIKCVELSGGAYSDSIEDQLANSPGDLMLQIHNYYPPPFEPFVFNLASANSEILEKSISHARQALRLSKYTRAPLYSFHAGFRLALNPSELGERFSRRKLDHRDLSLNIFGESVLKLAEEARLEGGKLLIENNVINKTNYDVYGDDPLLLTNPSEINSFMVNMPSNVELLLDVAHLKVSAKTLGFDLKDAHDQLKPWVGAYHLSDNNGLFDSNNGIDEGSWFWEGIKRGLDSYTLEVYNLDLDELKLQVELASKMLRKP